MTNLRVLEPSRKRQRPGDVFAMLLPDNQFLFGRVISIDAVVGPMTGVLLLYVYQHRADQMYLPNCRDLRPDQLLVAPILTNRKGWTEGVFQTVGHIPLDDDDLLAQHCFRRFNGDLFDERSNPMSRAAEPVGVFGLRSFRTIDDAISDALGFERAPD